MELADRIAQWRQNRNHVSLGNFGEQIAGRLLIRLGYQLLSAQDDFTGMVADVLGVDTHANAEDFIAVDPEQRFMTINSKASASMRSCRQTKSGNLTKPRLAHGQNRIQYSTLRAQLISPLEGDCYAQVVKVDLVRMKAQIFEIDDDGMFTALDQPHDVAAIADEVNASFPTDMPPPNVWDLV